MRRNLDNIEIVEPPIGELTKKRSIKGACLTSCAMILFFAIAAIIAIKIYVGSGPTLTKNIPANFPNEIPIYDNDNITNVTFVTAKYKQRGLGLATIIPKIVLSPVLYKNEENKISLNGIWKTISAPEKTYRDSFEVEWRDVNAEPSFVIGYYKKELKKKKFNIEVESSGEKIQQFSFSREDGYEGSVYAEVDPLKPRTTYIILTISLPQK